MRLMAGLLGAALLTEPVSHRRLWNGLKPVVVGPSPMARCWGFHGDLFRGYDGMAQWWVLMVVPWDTEIVDNLDSLGPTMTMIF